MNSGATRLVEACVDDAPMMRKLAEQLPALPFDEQKVRQGLEEIIARPEYGKTWLNEESEKFVVT